MVEDMKDVVSNMFDDFMDVARTVDGPRESAIFIVSFGLLILTGLAVAVGVLGSLWLILSRAPWILAVFAVGFGIPAGLLFWAKRSGKR